MRPAWQPPPSRPRRGSTWCWWTSVPGSAASSTSSPRAGRPPSGLDPQYRAGRALIDRLERSGCRILSQTQAWGLFGAHELAAVSHDASWTLRPRRLLLATGAYERGVPLPGWTLPGVMTTGAAQTLLRAYQVVPGRRVLVAGNGPLNMQVAAELVRAGATVVSLAESAPRPLPGRIASAARMLALAPDLIRDGLGYQLTLRRAGVPTLYRTALVRAEGDRQVEHATVARIDDSGRPVPGSERGFEVDAICMGYGFLSSTELSRAAGCRHRFDARQGQLVVDTDARGRTSVEDVWAIGDGAGVAGARVARSLGTLAALDAVRSLDGSPTRRSRGGAARSGAPTQGRGASRRRSGSSTARPV